MPHTRWNPTLFFGLAGLAVLIVSSWFAFDATRALWDAIDIAFYKATNNSLGESHSWAVFWAIANNRTFDMVPALLFAILFISYIREGAHSARTSVVERAFACVLAGLVVLLITQIERNFFEFGRQSPTMVMEYAVMLSEKVDWIATKDRSGDSFPSDHGTISMIFALFLAFFGGRKYALYGAIAVALSVLPRMVGGAHWLSDVAVGSTMLALPALVVMAATPWLGKTAIFLARPVRRYLPWAEPAFLAITDKERALLAVKGTCMGVADIVPGVSGATMAYVLGIYQQLLQAITRVNREWLGKILHFNLRGAVADIPFLFIIPITFGIALAIIIFTRLIPIPYLLTAYPEPLYGLFFGLIVGSVILMVMRHARAHVADALWLVAGCAVSYTLVSMIPADTPDEPWFIFICGVLAVSAMLLPGISGSFVLLILGKYALILEALGEFDLSLILPFGTGCIVGLLCFSHALNWVLKRYYLMSMMVITGMLIGSLHTVWPFQERIFGEIHGKSRLITSSPHWPTEDSPLIVTAVMMGIGLLSVLAIHWLAVRKRAQQKT